MRKMTLVLMGLVIVAFAAIGSVVWAAGEIWRGPTSADSASAVSIKPGSSVAMIAAQLKEAGVINSPLLFKVWVKLTGQSTFLQAGNYEIPDGSGIAAVVDDLHYGRHQVDITIIVPEGYTLTQIGQLVESKLHISSADWDRVTGIDSPVDHVVDVTRDKPDSVDLEGYLFPDTYDFTPGTTAEEVVLRMITTLKRRLIENNINAYMGDGDPHNWHEIMTMASILEREVRDPKDMKMVADIFWRRLTIGMALQADSTVNYVTGNTAPGVSAQDLQIDSPYNTYKYPGLPPGPISNPGIAAIGAAVHPTANDYYYFLTTKDGTVLYARTLEEHNANKAKAR